MDREQAIDLINSSLREGAELRIEVARDCSAAIFEAAGLIIMCLRTGGKLLFFGNGGSAADAQHLAAEFIGRFVREREIGRASCRERVEVSVDVVAGQIRYTGIVDR